MTEIFGGISKKVSKPNINIEKYKCGKNISSACPKEATIVGGNPIETSGQISDRNV
jgi:hypothetical protein